MKGAAGCNAECPGASSECCGTVMRQEGAARAVGKVGGRRFESVARAAVSVAGFRFRLTVDRRLCFG
jgi:hypothetical protein